MTAAEINRDETGRLPREAVVRAAFVRQAELCDSLGSPFTAAVCRLCATRLDASTEIGQRILTWPGDPVDAALALRLAGGLHALVLSGGSPELAKTYPPAAFDAKVLWQTVSKALVEHAGVLGAALDRFPQTNEVGRSAMLLPGFLTIAAESKLPLALLELGASAGLNLLWDRFSYRYGQNAWGDPDARVKLMPELRGRAPILDGTAEVVSRAGVDLAPINVNDPHNRLRLRSYIWADQRDRLARLDGALALAQELNLHVEAGDAGAWLEAKLAAQRTDVAVVVFHSIVWQYLPDVTQQRVSTALHGRGAAASIDRPLFWLRFEGVAGRGPALLSLTQWPGMENRVLAEGDYHGRWLDWRGSR